MSSAQNGEQPGAAEQLFVVHVLDVQEKKLAGHDGGQYQSPAQDRERALALVARLLGRPLPPNGTPEQEWCVALAGGTRSITLRRAGP